MHLIRRIFNFYIFSNIHVAIGTFCFVKLTLLSAHVSENKTGLFVFFSTIVSYNFIRFVNLSKRNNWLAYWFLKQKSSLIILSVISSSCCLYLFFGLKWNAVVILMPFVLLTFFYSMPLPKKMISLRRIPGLKIFLIAFCFAGITVIFPLVQNEILISSTVWILFLQRFLFVILITIPFDIRDVEFDSLRLKTIPQYFGVTIAKIIGVFFGMLVVFLEYIFLFEFFFKSVILLFICILSIFLLIFSKKNQSNYYSAFWVESLPIFWFILLVLVINF